MKYFIKILLILALLQLLTTCNRQKKSTILITNKIVYDVNINNKDPEMDWWVQNIEGSKRRHF